MRDGMMKARKGVLAAMLAVVIGAATGVAGAAGAQNRGQDPEKHVLTHFSQHGQWDLFCGHFGDPKAERCDLRRTDILNPRPNFRAMVIYLRFDKAGPVINIDAERTTFWVGGGLKVDGAWHYRMDGCVNGRCPLTGAVAQQFLDKLRQAKAISLAFTDIVTAKEVDWDLADLRKALAELAALRQKKGLP